jgi:hypothetical protein
LYSLRPFYSPRACGADAALALALRVGLVRAAAAVSFCWPMAVEESGFFPHYFLLSFLYIFTLWNAREAY